MNASSILRRLFSLLLLLLAAAGCEIAAPPAEQDAEGSAADETAGPQSLPPADPEGFTYYRWDDVYAAGRPEWAWAIASDHGDLEKIETLLADGFDPDTLIGGDYTDPSASRYGLYRTALIEAAWFGYDDVAERLLEAGADPGIHELTYDDDGREMGRGGDTALHKAASKGNARLVRKLLDAGVPVDVEGFDGYTPLFSSQTDLTTFQVLLKAGADLERAGGVTGLFDSARDPEVALFLLERGADIEGVEGKRQYGYTPLWSAAVRGDEEMVLFLLEHGADPNVRPASGDLVELARAAGHPEIASLLELARTGRPLRAPAEAPERHLVEAPDPPG